MPPSIPPATRPHVMGYPTRTPRLTRRTLKNIHVIAKSVTQSATGTDMIGRRKDDIGPVAVDMATSLGSLTFQNSEGCEVIVSLNGKLDRKSTRLNSSHGYISYAVFCLKKKTH